MIDPEDAARYSMFGVDWGHLAVYALIFYIPLAPFAFKFAKDKSVGTAVSTLITGLLYVLIFLWIAGGSLLVFGIGVAIDRPAENCGVGCIEPASAHWELPHLKFLAIGAGLIFAAWWLGKGMEALQQWSSDRGVRNRDHGRPVEKFDFDAHQKTMESINALGEALKRGEVPFPKVPHGPEK